MSLLSQPGLTDEQVDRIAARFSYDLLPALEAITDVQVRRALAEAVLAVRRRGASAAPDRNDKQFSLAAAMNLVSGLATSQGDLAVAERLSADIIGETLSSLGDEVDFSRPATSAEAAANEEFAQRRALAESERSLNHYWPEAPVVDCDDPQSLNNYLQALALKLGEDDAMLRDRETELERIQTEIRARKLAQREVLCIALDNLGDVALARGDLMAAKQHYTGSLDIQEAPATRSLHGGRTAARTQPTNRSFLLSHGE